MTSLTDIPSLIALIRSIHGDIPILGERFLTRPALRPVRRLTDKCRDDVAASLVALANADLGGVIVLGVNCARGGSVEGVGDVEAAQATVEAVARELVPVPEVEVVPCELREGTVLAVRVEPVVGSVGCFDARRGAVRGRFRFKDGAVVEWLREREQAPRETATEAREPADPSELDPVEDASLSDLEPILLGRACPSTLGASGASGPFDGPDAALERAGVLVPGLFHGHPTVAGLVCFGPVPSRFVRGAWFRVQVEGRAGFGRVDGPAFHIVEQAMRMHAVAEGVDPDLLREVLFNAVAHRSYDEEDRHRPVEVVRWRDRLEVVSPGEALDAEALVGARSGRATRNPRLLGLLRRVGIARDEGTGLRRAVEQATARGFEAPRVYSRDGEVRVVLAVRSSDEVATGVSARGGARVVVPHEARPVMPRAAPLTPARTPAPGVEGPPVARPAPLVPPARPKPLPNPTPFLASTAKSSVERLSLSSREDAVLALLREHGRLTTREIVAALGWTRATTRLVLASLVESGEVRTSSPSPRSPDQSYQVAQSAG